MLQKSLSNKERLSWLRLSRSENVGSKTFFSLLQLYGSAEIALERVQNMSIKGGRKKPIKLCTLAEATREIESTYAFGGEIIATCEREFPPYLRNIHDCPPVITVHGQKHLLQNHSIAIVGARNASANGCRFASMLAEELGQAEFVCISGLARGVDTAVHKGALKTGTIAVIAGGIDNVYPKENADLYKAIREQGLIIAESPYGSLPRSQSFPRRNRIISGLSYGTVVVEASFKSGSLITSRFALEQDREVFAVPGFPLDPRCRGTNNLIRQGAVITESARDVIAHIQHFIDQPLLNLAEKEPSDFISAVVPPNDNAVKNARLAIIEKLGPSPVAVDEIVIQLGIGTNIVLTVLLELELAGRLERHAGNAVSLLYNETEDLFSVM